MHTVRIDGHDFATTYQTLRFNRRNFVERLFVNDFDGEKTHYHEQ